MAFSMAWGESWVEGGAGEDRARALLAGFRRELYWCLGRRADVLFEVADALLCKQDPGAHAGGVVAGAGVPPRPRGGV